MAKTLTLTTGVWRPATLQQKMQALILLSKLPMRNPTELELVKAVYLIALEGVTAFGLEQATKAIIRGSLGHPFMPAPPELKLEIDRIMESEHEKLALDRRLKWPEDEHRAEHPPDAEARQRMGELWQRVRPMFEPPKPAEPPRPRSWQEVEADLLAHANDPIQISPALLKALDAAKDVEADHP